MDKALLSQPRSTFDRVIRIGSAVTICIWCFLLVRQFVHAVRVFRIAAEGPIPNMGPTPFEFAFKLLLPETLYTLALASTGIWFGVAAFRSQPRWASLGLLSVSVVALYHGFWPLHYVFAHPLNVFFLCLFAVQVSSALFWLFVFLRQSYSQNA